MNQQFDQKTIETLKAARNQVMQAPLKAVPLTGQADSRNESPKQAQFPMRNKFAEEFIQKLASIEQKTAAVEEEMAKVEKFWSTLVEKKKQLETRRSELTKVKDKLKELDKEMGDALKS